MQSLCQSTPSIFLGVQRHSDLAALFQSAGDALVAARGGDGKTPAAGTLADAVADVQEGELHEETGAVLANLRTASDTGRVVAADRTHLYGFLLLFGLKHTNISWSYTLKSLNKVVAFIVL